MNTLAEYLDSHGYEVDPGPDPLLAELAPCGTWERIDRDSVVDNVAVYGDRSLDLPGFRSTVVVSRCAITPRITDAEVFEHLTATSLVLPGWTVVATHRETATEQSTQELVGRFTIDEVDFLSTSVATLRHEDDRTVLFQVVVTTPADRARAHAPAVRNAVPAPAGDTGSTSGTTDGNDTGPADVSAGPLRL